MLALRLTRPARIFHMPTKQPELVLGGGDVALRQLLQRYDAAVHEVIAALTEGTPVFVRDVAPAEPENGLRSAPLRMVLNESDAERQCLI